MNETVKKFVPVENELALLNQKPCRAVEWYLLVRDAEAYRKRTGMGLATVWGCIAKDEYAQARRRMDVLLLEEYR